MKSKTDLLIKISLFLYAATILLNETVVFKTGVVGLLLLKVIAIILALIYYSKHAKKNSNYTVALLTLILPFFWNNYYFQDSQWIKIINYIPTIIYAIILARTKIEKNIITFALKTIVAFGIFTSIISWLELVSPSLYEQLIKQFFPAHIVEENMTELTLRNNLCGFASHYSRNAMFVLGAIISAFYTEDEKKKKIIILAILGITLLSIGKRAHVLFLIVSIIMGYIIIRRCKIKTILKIIGIASIATIMTIFAINNIPQIRHTYDRFLIQENGGDITTGRLAMYEDAYKLYTENNYVPLGWGAYAHSTDYFHPGLHNDYLQLYYEVGIIGAILVLGPDIFLLIQSAKNSRNTKENIARIALVYNIFFMLHSAMGMPHYDIETLYFYMLFNAMLQSRLGEEK